MEGRNAGIRARESNERKRSKVEARIQDVQRQMEQCDKAVMRCTEELNWCRRQRETGVEKRGMKEVIRRMKNNEDAHDRLSNEMQLLLRTRAVLEGERQRLAMDVW